MTSDRMTNGAYRTTFKFEDEPEQVAIGMTRMQSLDKAFSEVRKIVSKIKEITCSDQS